MVHQIRIKLCLVAMLLTIASQYCRAQSFASGPDGGSNGSGGDIYAQEFKMIGRSLVKNFNDLGIPASVSITKQMLEQAVDNNKVSTVDHTILNGLEVDLINYPEQHLIQLGRIRWAAIKPEDRYRKVSIALHEYLGLITTMDRDYKISDVVLDKLKPLLLSPIPKYTSSSFVCNISLWHESSGLSGRLQSNPLSGSFLVASIDTQETPNSGISKYNDQYIRTRYWSTLNNHGNFSDAGELADYGVMIYLYRPDYLRPEAPAQLSYQIFNTHGSPKETNWTPLGTEKMVHFPDGLSKSQLTGLVALDSTDHNSINNSTMTCYKY